MFPIPHHNFGGNGPLIHFAHANAYPPGCFRQMLTPLTNHYQIIGMHHRALWPGSQPQQVTSWHQFADDLIQFLQQQNLQNIIGIGHSMGAVTTMLAALKQPTLFSQLILIDPVFFPQKLIQTITTNPDLTKQNPLYQRTLNRRRHWPSPQEAFHHFRAKTPFQQWTDIALKDYIQQGMHQDQGQITLTFTPEWEAHIYSIPPLTVWQDIPHLTHPTLAIRGQTSHTLLPDAWQHWQQLQPQAQFIEIPDTGHMIPMQRPQHLAQIILNHLQATN